LTNQKKTRYTGESLENIFLSRTDSKYILIRTAKGIHETDNWRKAQTKKSKTIAKMC
jgi:hypothetical protein